MIILMLPRVRRATSKVGYDLKNPEWLNGTVR